MSDHVFVCYARRDERFVLDLAGRLKARGVRVWVDQWDIPVGADWDQAIDTALHECGRFLIVLSPDAVASREVRSELRTALNADKHIIPVLHRTCQIPRQLSLIQFVDFVGREPGNGPALDRLVAALGTSAPSSAPQPSSGASPGPLERALVLPATAGATERGGTQARAADVSPVEPADPARSRARLAESLVKGVEDPVPILRPLRPMPQPARATPSRPVTTATPPARGELRAGVPAGTRPAGGPEQLVARVKRYYDAIGVAGLQVLDRIEVGDVVRFRGAGHDVVQVAASIERDRVKVTEAPAGAEVGLKVSQPVREGDAVYRVSVALMLIDREVELGVRAEPGHDLVGIVQGYYSRVGAATVLLGAGDKLAKGDSLRIRGRSTDLRLRVESLQIDRKPRAKVEGPAVVGLGVPAAVRSRDLVYKVTGK